MKFVKFNITSKWKSGALLALGAFILGNTAIAQAPRYTPPPPPTKHAKLELRLRYLVPPDIQFTGLGSVPFKESYDTAGNLIDGTLRSIGYDDGYLAQDFVSADLVEGDISQSIPSDNTSATSNFGYANPEQVDRDADPSALMFHRYAASTDSMSEFEGSGSGSIGWELNYTKFINRRRNLGVQVGFSYNGFDSRFNGSIDADLHTQTFVHNMADGNVPELVEVEDDEGNITYEPYIGNPVIVEGEDEPLLNWEGTELPEEVLEGGAVVDSQADLRSNIYNFRAGTTYALNLGQSFSFQLGAGVSALYVDGHFRAFDELTNTTAVSNPLRAMTTTDDAEWQVGGYVDASAYYNFTERVSLFSGLQVQSGSEYSQQNEERTATVDFSSQIYVHAGVGIKF